MLPAFSKEGSGGQRVPQGSPSSQIEKKSVDNISKDPTRKEIHSDKFQKSK